MHARSCKLQQDERHEDCHKTALVSPRRLVLQLKSRRTVEYAFGYAFLNNRKKVTAVHKANIMKLSDGLFLKVQQLFESPRPT